MKPCLVCGELSDRSRCEQHWPHQVKASAAARGYDAAWHRLSRKARRMQQSCTDCGATDDLQADHSPEAWRRKAAGKSIRLVDIDVVCGQCNRRRGSARPSTTTPVARPAPFRPFGKARSALHTPLATST